ncbi:hypothetical protein LINPERPRIM_LOCUS4484 [Linum perenne]
MWHLVTGRRILDMDERLLPLASSGVEIGKSPFPTLSAKITGLRTCLPIMVILLILVFMLIVLTPRDRFIHLARSMAEPGLVQGGAKL